MAYNYNFFTPSDPSSKTSSSNPGRPISTFGRVVEVVYEDKEDKSREGGVYFKPLGSSIPEDDFNSLPFAFLGEFNSFKLPLKGELIKLETAPSTNLETSISENRTYYSSIINLFNNASYVGHPDVYRYGYEVDLGEDQVEPNSSNSVRLYPGDSIIQGRLGQLIKFTGLKGPYTDNSNVNKPLLIISNGRSNQQEPFDRVDDNVNTDPSSVYLTSDHTIPLTQANTKRSSYKERIPENFDSYRGSQVLFNADRLVFNSRANHILLSSAESVGINGTSINLDSNKYIALDAPDIYLGSNSFKEEQPVLLGNETVKQLTKLIDSLIDFFSELSSATTISGEIIPKFLQTVPTVTGKLNNIKRDLDSTKSRKIWVD